MDGLTLTAVEKEIAIACQEPKIKDLPVPVVGLFMNGLIGRTFLNTGGDFDKNKHTIDATIDELVSDLKKYNGTLSLQEIEIAFKNGWKKEYGDFFGLNNATYFGWINSYTWNEKRLRAKKAISDAKNKPQNKPEMTDEEKNEIIKQGVITCFENYKKTGNLIDAGNVKYNYLDKMGKIQFTKEKKLEIMATVKTQMVEEMKIKMLDPKIFGQYRQLKQLLTEIEGGKSESLKAESKREALKIHFDNLIAIGDNPF